MLLEPTFSLSYYRDAEIFTWEIGAGGFVHTGYRKVASGGCSAGLGAAGGDDPMGRQPGLRDGSAESQGSATGFAKSPPRREKERLLGASASRGGV